MPADSPTISFCAPADVLLQFPLFVPNQAQNVTNDAIQMWLDDAAAYIISLFLARTINIQAIQSSPGLNPVQQYVLRGLNRESGVRDLAVVLKYTTAVQDMNGFGGPNDTPKTPFTASRFRDGRFSEVMRGTFDQLFAPGIARTVSITNTIPGSIAGGDTDPSLTTPASEGLNCKFTKGMEF